MMKTMMRLMVLIINQSLTGILMMERVIMVVVVMVVCVVQLFSCVLLEMSVQNIRTQL